MIRIRAIGRRKQRPEQLVHVDRGQRVADLVSEEFLGFSDRKTPMLDVRIDLALRIGSQCRHAEQAEHEQETMKRAHARV